MSEGELVCTELGPALDELEASGYRLDCIYPADDPHTAILSRGGDSVRLTSRPGANLPDGLPKFRPQTLVSPAGGAPGEGRAAMLYRDLVPGRLGGRYIASHIAIADGGPVSDWVHFHHIRLQLIYVRHGWVRVVYEDQGDPFVMEAGDLVVQPPEIRHRVLESSKGAEVVEIGAPALHATFADHELELPNGRIDRSRRFGGQTFLRHVAAEAEWSLFAGGEAQETAVERATGGLANVRTIRSKGADLRFAPHAGELVFGFVLNGNARLETGASDPLEGGDSFVVEPGRSWSIRDASEDFRLLHVTTSSLD